MKHVLLFAAILLLSSCGVGKEGYPVDFHLRDASGNVLLYAGFESIEAYEAQIPQISRQVREIWEKHSWQTLTCDWQVISSEDERLRQVRDVEISTRTTTRVSFVVNLVKDKTEYTAIQQDDGLDLVESGDAVSLVHVLFERALERIKVIEEVSGVEESREIN